MSARKVSAWVLAALGAALGVLIGLGALVLGALGCYESCDDRSAHWSNDPSAWQWDAMIGVGAAGAAVAIVTAVAVWRRRATSARAATGVWLVLAAVLYVVVDQARVGAEQLLGLAQFGNLALFVAALAAADWRVAAVDGGAARSTSS